MDLNTPTTERFLADLFNIVKNSFRKKMEPSTLAIDPKKMPKGSSPTEQFIFKANNDIMKQVDYFMKTNKNELKDYLEHQSAHGISKLIEEKLYPNIDVYSKNLKLPANVASDPNRRTPAYQDEVFDKIKDVFEKGNGNVSLKDIQKNIEKTLISKLSEPNHSHHEQTGVSPRMEKVVKISEETRLEMMRDTGPSNSTPSPSSAPSSSEPSSSPAPK